VPTISTRQNAFFQGKKIENANENYCNVSWVDAMDKKKETERIIYSKQEEDKERRLEMYVACVYSGVLSVSWA